MNEDGESTVVLPLAWNGSTLSIPQASSTQDGYLSRDDYVLFSGGTVVPVTSFNTRTGEVVLLEDDVLAALGYVPLNKHGDTMTGPLTLSGDPTLPLHAATRQYVLANTDPAAAPPATWYTRDFNASGSDARFTGTASSGSPTLTLSAAHDFAPGQGILIKGGGSSSGITGALLTKVAAIAGNVITLHDVVTSAVSAVTANVMHDDTVAINTALQAVVDGKGGKLVFDPGTYNVNGPILSSNSIIRLPYNATTNPTIAVSMMGQPQPGMCFSLGGVGPAKYGVIVQTEVHNAAAAIFAATAYSATITDLSWYNNITLFMDGFTFRTYNDPQISGLDLAGCDNICIRNIQIDAGTPFLSAAQPTAAATFGLRTPAISAGMANHFAENVVIFNYYTGLKFSELLRANLIQVFRCMVGMEFMQSYYTAHFYSCLVWHCPTSVYISPAPSTCRGVLDMALDIEFNSGGGWDVPLAGRDLYDPANIGSGLVKVLKIANDGIGTKGQPSVTGFSKAEVLDLGSGKHLVPVTISGDLTVTGSANVGGTLSLTGQAVTAGADNSATAAGYRELQVPNAAPISLLANLVSYWKLDEATGTRADSHGSSPFTPVTTVATAAGRYGTLGASFDATNHLEATGSGLQTGNNSFSVALWVKLDSKSPPADQDFLMKGTGTAQNEFFVGYSGTDDKFRFGMISAAGTFTVILASSAGSPVVGTWYLITAWFDYPNDQMHIQVNNLAVDSGVPPLPQNADTAVLNCGSYGSGYANGAHATVDEVAFWKPRVLDAATRNALWNGSAGVPFGSWT